VGEAGGRGSGYGHGRRARLAWRRLARAAGVEETSIGGQCGDQCGRPVWRRTDGPRSAWVAVVEETGSPRQVRQQCPRSAGVWEAVGGGVHIHAALACRRTRWAVLYRHERESKLKRSDQMRGWAGACKDRVYLF
jgi:hypothetical protein